MKNKILLIQPYFGTLPSYIPLWLESIRNNSWIDFLFITNEDIETYNLPLNMKVVRMSLEEFIEVSRKKLKQKITISTPYKICDLKPLYGVIFRDYLKNYSHWGYSDIDMYMGNLKNFITEELLTSFPKIGVYGHLMIFQNNKDSNQLLLNNTDLPYSTEEFLCSQKMYNTDEAGGINYIYFKNQLEQVKLPILDISYKQKKWKANGYFDYYQMFYVHKGNVYIVRSSKKRKEVKVEEVCYIHYQKRPINIIKGLDYQKPFVFSEDGVFNFELSDLENVLFRHSLSKMYLRIHTIKNFFSKLCSYVLGRNIYSLKARRIASKMIAKQNSEIVRGNIEISNIRKK